MSNTNNNTLWMLCFYDSLSVLGILIYFQKKCNKKKMMNHGKLSYCPSECVLSYGVTRVSAIIFESFA